MKPVLVVEGEKHVGEIRLYGYYDKNNEYHSVTHDDVEKVEYQGRYEPIEVLIRKRIEAHEEVLADYEAQLMDEYKANLKAPFVCDKMRLLAEKHVYLTQVVEGLCEALEIITNESFMQDDVDLSGGEDDASMQRMQPF